MDEDWDDAPAGGGTATAGDTGTTIIAEMPEIKLFGKWSCDDVEVVDMSLQVHQLNDFQGGSARYRILLRANL